MATQEHLDILKQGVEVWNRWRKEQPITILPDLSGANLVEADLVGADLRVVNLSRANLTTARLEDAHLHGAKLNGTDLHYALLLKADLYRAILSEANLSGACCVGAFLVADLSGANLSRADLSYASLNDADLHRANLSGANLTGADLSGARVAGTIFGNIDLRTVQGLEHVRHEGPSTIGTDTLERSQGRIPEVFLRRAGLSDDLIAYARSLTQHPIEYYTCFISYSSHDEDFARRLYADLQSKDVRCWFAPEDLKIGDHYHQRIDESIRLYDKLILILSEHALQSPRVEREVVAAREKEDYEQHLVLFPVRLDDAVMNTTKAWAADVRRRWHIGDFTRWKHHDTYQKAFDRLLRDLKAETQV